MGKEGQIIGMAVTNTTIPFAGQALARGFMEVILLWLWVTEAMEVGIVSGTGSLDCLR